jgi:DNA-binding MarR family transcriptional regulator
MQLIDEGPASEGPVSPTLVVDSVLHTAMAIGRLMRQRLAGDQLEPATYWVLKNLAPGSMRITALASSTQLDTSTVSRHVTQLEQAGLVERSQDPDDGRAQRVGLTDEGRTQLAASTARRREVLTHSLESWETDDLADLDRLLGRLVTSIESRTH